MLNRRAFLGTVGAVAAAALLPAPAVAAAPAITLGPVSSVSFGWEPLKVGDVIRIQGERREYVITAITQSSIDVDGPFFYK